MVYKDHRGGQNRDTCQSAANDEKTAEADSLLLGQAQDRAKNLLESYIKGVGEALGETYTVAWEEVE